MPTYKLTLAYDGTGLVGWQRQPEGTSVQGLLENALREFDGTAVSVAGAGRTDAGVHALGQVASFTMDRVIACDVLARALNAKLPEAVRVLAAEEVPASFHARFSATWKTYRYRIWLGPAISPFERLYAWHIDGPLDVAAMAEAARALVGRHDFAAFQGTGSDVPTTVRTVTSSLVVRHALDERCSVPTAVSRSNDGPLVTYEITGDGFLRHMVRNIVGTLVDIGRGRRSVGWMREVLASRNRLTAGRTAPAAGLFLVSVEYAPLADEP